MTVRPASRRAPPWRRASPAAPATKTRRPADGRGDLGADRGAPRDGTRRLRQNVRLQVVRKPEEREEGSPPAVEAGLGQRLRDGHPREVRRHEVQPRGRFHPGPRQAPQPPGALLWGFAA